MTDSLNRRSAMRGGAAFAALGSGLLGSLASAQAQRRTPRPIPFGVAINPAHTVTDAPYASAVLAHADFVVPEWGMKWGDMRPSREAFNFEISDRAVDFARKNGLPIRGHTLVWNEVTPKWLDAMTSPAEIEREMLRHIETLVLRYRGTIRSWDVVNEPIADKPARGENLRAGVFTRAMGGDYIERALKHSRALDPTAELVVNEYGIENDTPQDKSKRASFRQLIRRLMDRGIPLDGVGLQAHLIGTTPIDVAGVTAFVRELRSWGLKVFVTELDLNDKDMVADIAERDRLSALHVKTFLEAVLAGGRPQSIATWGITDRYTWMPTWHKRRDGLPNRSLPLDADLKPKPFLAVVEDICRRAG
jgi:endo-1,4-beta-xylanase